MLCSDLRELCTRLELLLLFLVRMEIAGLVRWDLALASGSDCSCLMLDSTFVACCCVWSLAMMAGSDAYVEIGLNGLCGSSLMSVLWTSYDDLRLRVRLVRVVRL
jgi:hypothetical protein